MKSSMRAMVFRPGSRQLALEELAIPEPAPGQVRVKTLACGICRTDLHVIDGELGEPKVPVVPGHQVVGMVDALGEGVRGVSIGETVGIPWLGSTCRSCPMCTTGRENLCDDARFTGYQIDGGFADYTVADADFVFPLPEGFDPLDAAPLLCAGLIGYRALRFCKDASRVALYGFGAAAHIITQVAIHLGHEVFAVTRPGDTRSQSFARSLGASWAGGTNEPLPRPPTSAIIFAPAGELVPLALAGVEAGGTVVCAGIHMSDIPSFPYETLWHERTLCSVANLTRQDGEEFMALAPKVPVRTTITPYSLESANAALDDLRNGRFDGAAVLDLSLD